MIKRQINLDTISDDNLLSTRICDLPLAIEGTWLSDRIQQLYSELEKNQILYFPQCYLADEWLTPQNETCIGIPFYLAHPRLISLEKQIMKEAEGEGRDWCMKLLRHEAGHALCYAFRLHRKPKWRQIFGSASVEYKEGFKYRAYSKNYVKHLEGYYAQLHPEEDFVETFAVWLTPGSNWREVYKDWPAIKKLNYVDELMRSIQNKPPRNASSVKEYRISQLRLQLKSYYKRKQMNLAEDLPDFHDSFIKQSFVLNQDTDSKLEPADRVIRKHRHTILESIARSSGEKKYVINDLFKNIVKRSRELNALTSDDETSVCLNTSSYITSLIMHYQYTGRFRGEKKGL